MSVPLLRTAEQFLRDAEQINPGAWVQHSYYVADAAARFATHIPHLDAETARFCGLLHDIGRRNGVTGMRHIIDGYTFLTNEGYTQAARIALTHSFPIRDITYSIGEWDCTPKEYTFVQKYLQEIIYDDYDRLFQLCDALALPNGFCILEKRFVDVALRYGVYSSLPERWKATLELQKYFEKLLGKSIYSYLPNIARSTFGVENVGELFSQ